MLPQKTRGSEKSNISSFVFARETEGFSSTPRPMGRAQHYKTWDVKKLYGGAGVCFCLLSFVSSVFRTNNVIMSHDKGTCHAREEKPTS